jgi:hypothetical protein
MSKKKSNGASMPTPTQNFVPPEQRQGELRETADAFSDLEQQGAAAEFEALQERAALAALSGLIATMPEPFLHHDEIIKSAWELGEKFAKAKPQ